MRTKRTTTRRFTILVALVLLMTLSTATIAFALTGSPFEGHDGNLVVDGGGGAQDWANAPNFTSMADPQKGTPDTTAFGQGTKSDSTDPSVVTDGIPPNKDDFRAFYAAYEKVNGDTFLYLAWVRYNNLGSAHMGFELNQQNTILNSGNLPVRQAGDLLVNYDFGGSGDPVISISEWVETGDKSLCEANNSTPCWGVAQTLDASVAEAAINSGPVNDPYLGESLIADTFGELAINLTDAGIFPVGECTSFNSAYLMSRSSASFDAALKDFVAPVGTTISNCGTITIEKETIPDGDTTTDFSFTAPGLGTGSFTLKDDGSITFTDVLAGDYTVTEADPSASGYEFDDITCTASDGSLFNESGTGVTISLEADDDVTCTFFNNKLAKLIVKKETDPDGSAQSFDFGVTGPGGYNDTFSLVDGGSDDSGYIQPGTYTVTETVPAGWVLQSATCDNGDNDATNGVTLAYGDVVTCTFTNQAQAKLIIAKETEPDGDTTDFSFNVSGPGGYADSFALSDGESDDSGFITPGTYSASETVPAGWNLKSATCSDGSDPSSIGLDAGETVTCTFTNEQLFEIIVLVCRQADNTLYASNVTLGGDTFASLGSAPAGFTDAELCGLGGANFENKIRATYNLSVVIQ